jgi:hypothetical protein
MDRALIEHDYESARWELRRRVTEVLEAAKQSRPPVNLYHVARYCNVTRIMRKQLSVDAQINKQGNSYDILLNSAAPRLRQRFSLAHEIAHTFFIEDDPEPRTRQRCATPSERNRFRKEEKLCDFGAGELLMPAAPFLADALLVGPSCIAAQWLAKRWDVSLKACVARIVELNAWPAACVWLCSGEQGIQITHTVGLPASAAFRSEPYSRRGLVGRAIASGENWHGRMTLSIGGPGQSYYCDILPRSRGDSMLLVILAEDAEALNKRSRLAIWSRGARRTSAQG